MNDEVYAFALKSTLNEIQYACPDVTSNFIFKDCKLVATDETTEEETATKTMDAFNDIVERADIIGDVENITIQTAKGKVTIATINKLQLATVSSKEVDEKYVNTLTRTLIPTVIRLVDEIQPASTDNETTTLDQPEPEDVADDKAEETENLGETADNTEDYEKYEDNKDYKNYQLEEAEETTATEPEEGEEVVQ